MFKGEIISRRAKAFPKGFVLGLVVGCEFPTYVEYANHEAMATHIPRKSMYIQHVFGQKKPQQIYIWLDELCCRRLVERRIPKDTIDLAEADVGYY